MSGSLCDHACSTVWMTARDGERFTASCDCPDHAVTIRRDYGYSGTGFIFGTHIVPLWPVVLTLAAFLIGHFT